MHAVNVFLTVVSLTFLTVIPSTVATGHSFNQCMFQTDCASGFSCYEYKVSQNAFVFCSLDGTDECFCLPFANIARPTTCNDTADCKSPFEACAKDGTSSYCTSCDALLTNSTVFDLTLINANETKCTSVPTITPSPAPPAKVQAFNDDYCTYFDSECEFCGDRYNFLCSPQSAWCTCLIDTVACESSADCIDLQNTVCVSDIETGNQTCVACTRVGQDVRLKPLDSVGEACKTVPPRRGVDMPHGPNGFTADACWSSLQCQPGRRCASGLLGDPRTIFCDEVDNAVNSRAACMCMPAKFKTCTSATDCDQGEACATVENQQSPTCISANIARAYRARLMRIVYDAVNPTPEITAKLTYEECKYDWDCKSPRRCKHVADTDTFGGCAGREACECEPLYLEPCDNSGDCEQGESCASVEGSQMGSFCAADSAIAADWTLLVVDEAYETGDVTGEPEAAPEGLTGDRCSQSDDCAGRRICRHVTESGTMQCNGRAGCTCAYGDGEDGMCDRNMQCSSGERCMVVKDAVRTTNGTCLSEWAVTNDRRSRYIEMNTTTTMEGVVMSSPMPSPGF